MVPLTKTASQQTVHRPASLSVPNSLCSKCRTHLINIRFPNHLQPTPQRWMNTHTHTKRVDVLWGWGGLLTRTEQMLICLLRKNLHHIHLQFKDTDGKNEQMLENDARALRELCSGAVISSHRVTCRQSPFITSSCLWAQTQRGSLHTQVSLFRVKPLWKLSLRLFPFVTWLSWNPGL